MGDGISVCRDASQLTSLCKGDWLSSAMRCRGGALVGIETGFMGPNYSISTACAAANYCFVAAANHIRRGEADIMLAGGSEAPIIPIGLGGFVACRQAACSSTKPLPVEQHCYCGSNLVAHSHAMLSRAQIRIIEAISAQHKGLMIVMIDGGNMSSFTYKIDIAM